jgi:hypothetical protein
MGKNPKKLWTETELAKLRSMAGNYPTHAIAQELGRGVSATVVKAHELKVSLRVKSKRDSKDDAIGRLELWPEGMVLF